MRTRRSHYRYLQGCRRQTIGRQERRESLRSWEKRKGYALITSEAAKSYDVYIRYLFHETTPPRLQRRRPRLGGAQYLPIADATDMPLCAEYLILTPGAIERAKKNVGAPARVGRPSLRARGCIGRIGPLGYTQCHSTRQKTRMARGRSRGP